MKHILISDHPSFARILPVFVLVAVLSVSCNKRCHCYGYDGGHYYFTPEEVEAQETSCSNMIYFDGTNRLYSICEWDY